MQNLIFFSDKIAERFGRKLYRIPFDLHFGCPNRIDRYGRGCTFCAEDGARARHLCRSGNDLSEQLMRGVEYIWRRYHSRGPYIAYFQAFTSTFAPVETLRKVYSGILEAADFPVVIISTRPDALPPETLDYLAEIREQRELWVELGIQSSSDATLHRVNRGHDFAAVKQAVCALKVRNINVAGHLMLGLPGESEAQYLQTARDVAPLHLDALKIHPLTVLKKTALAEEFHHAPFPLLNEYDYARNLANVLREFPQGTQLMRLSAEFAPEEIIGPKWWMSKSEFLTFFRDYFAAGDFSGCFARVPTWDGSCTLYHPEFRQNFHSLAGADSEAEQKFVVPSGLAGKLAAGKSVRLLDIGFGLGLNTFAAIRAAQAEKNGRLEITALEYDKRVLAAARARSENNGEKAILQSLECNGVWQNEDGNILLRLLLDDARKTIRILPDSHFDLIFQDGFSPDVNPELWSYDFEREVARTLRQDGMLLSYCGAYPYLGALLRCGLSVGVTPAFGRRRGGTAAGKNALPDFPGLADKERNIVLHSTAGAAYRDPGLDNDRAAIAARRKCLCETLHRHGVPKWFRAGKEQAL